MPVQPAKPCHVWCRYPGLSKHYFTGVKDNAWLPGVSNAETFKTPAWALHFLMELTKADRLDFNLEYGIESKMDAKDIVVMESPPETLPKVTATIEPKCIECDAPAAAHEYLCLECLEKYETSQ